MCRRLIFLMVFVLVLGLHGLVRGDILFHWSFDGPLGEAVVSDTDIISGVTVTKFYDTENEGGAEWEVRYAEPNPWFNSKGTSAEFNNDPCENTWGAGLFAKDPGTDSLLDLTNLSKFTIEAFIYPYNTAQSVIIRKYGGAADARYYLEVTGGEETGQARFAINGDAGSRTGTGSDSLVANSKWYHVAGVFDTNDTEAPMKIYLDGELKGVLDQNDLVAESTRGLGIGCIIRDNLVPPGNSGQFFCGRIDELRISDEALEPTEFTLYSGPLGAASNPSPLPVSKNLCRDVMLSWTPGPAATSHDVYFGTDFEAVKDANTTVTLGVYKGNQDANTYDAAALESLQLGATYYWRIDEVTDSGTITGAVWNFSLNDGGGYDPEPADDAFRVALDAALSWTPGCDATSHDVYLGTDFNDVNDATKSSHPNVDLTNVDVNSFDPPGEFDYFTTYYWRIDGVAASETHKGGVYSFRTQDVIPDPNLLVWLKLDETEGDTAFDSSGHEFNAQGDGFDDDQWIPLDGRFPGCAEFDDNARFDIDLEVLKLIDKEITIAMWAKGPYREGSDNWVFGMGTAEEMAVQIAIPDAAGQDIVWQAGDDANDLLLWEDAAPDTWQIDWHHLAFTKDENQGTLNIYFDAVEVASSPDVNVGTLAIIADGAARVGIGVQWSHSNDFEGRIDDFRMYDYALSASEIKEVMRGETAWAPRPYNGSTEVSRDVILKWRPGDSATSHDVYFGTDFNDVNDAGTSSDEYKGNQLRDANSYDPGGLILNTTYYWRIDEVSDSNMWKGTVWNFTVAEYIVIDDMESYCPGEVGGCAIMNNWLDGLENFSGATVKLGVEGTFPVRDQQSMEFSYDNDGDVAGWPADEYSEAELELDPAEDFTNWDQLDLKALRLYFYGDPDNDANDTEQMYLGVEDSNGNYVETRYGDNGEDMNDIRKAEWQQWNIELSALADEGLELDYVSKIYLGFGDRDNFVSGGEGVVYFDDIRLYIQTCVAYLLQPEADLNDDCIVNELDLEVMAREWLDKDIVFDTWTEPSADGLVGWWKLDDGSGDTAVDSSGGNDGTLEGKASWATGHDGGAVAFDGGRILVPDAEELRPIDVVSACAWVYLSDSQDSARVVVKGADNRESYGLEIDGSDELVFHIRDVNNVRHGASKEVLNLDEWFHIAGTFDGDVVRCYLNGVMVADNNQPNDMTLSQDPNDFAIGNRSDDDNRGFEGSIDDVRVYNRVLSDAEIAYLASDGTGLVEIQSVANLHSKEAVGDRAVNFKDYAVLIDGWLEQKLWPPEQ